jgi:hypothetical protein
LGDIKEARIALPGICNIKEALCLETVRKRRARNKVQRNADAELLCRRADIFIRPLTFCLWAALMGLSGIRECIDNHSQTANEFSHGQFTQEKFIHDAGFPLKIHRRALEYNARVVFGFLYFVFACCHTHSENLSSIYE